MAEKSKPRSPSLGWILLTALLAGSFSVLAGSHFEQPLVAFALAALIGLVIGRVARALFHRKT
jgi:mannose/fructose/N-acetylgalactosamine-specific phosphotransferase system component IIC